MATIGEAYLQIKPSMEGIQGELQEAMGDAGAKSSSSFGSAFASGLGLVTKVTAAAVTTAAAGVTKLTQEAVSSFADYEQLVGGVETLFGTGGAGLEEYAASIGKTASEAAEGYASLIQAQELVMNNADMAFKTAGLSANEYMETVTSFSASLLQSTAGDTLLAAEIADQAIIDMADNANKMGTSMESIQNAYQGFAKQNYTMLDNLKLGYGGTKEEMERLLADASALSGIEYDISNLADVYNAIHVIQEEMGIAGTTADEAEGTISGSLASVGAAWKNLVAGMANPNADLGTLIDQLVQTGITALDNLMPTIEQALIGIASLITQITPIIVQMLPGLVDTLVPPLIDAAIQLLNALVEALPSILSIILEQIPTLFDLVVNTILTMLPIIIDLGLQLIMALADGLIQNLPTLIPAIVGVVMTMVEKLTEPDTLVQLINAALQLIIALAEGLLKAVPELLGKVPIILANLVEAIIKAAPVLAQAALELVLTLAAGIVDSLARLNEKGKEMIDAVKDGFWEKIESAKNWGKDMIENFISGIKEKWEKLKSTVTDLASTIKSLLGFSEPEEGPLSNFHTFAPDMMTLFAQGIRDNLGLIQSAMGDVTGTIATDFSTAQIATNNYSPIADPNERLYGLVGQNMAVDGGDITIPIYIGQEKLDTIILNAQQRHALVSGGR